MADGDVSVCPAAHLLDLASEPDLRVKEARLRRPKAGPEGQDGQGRQLLGLLPQLQPLAQLLGTVQAVLQQRLALGLVPRVRA